jgi:predicted RNA-binding protein
MSEQEDNKPRYQVIIPKGDYDYYTVIDRESDIRPNFQVVVIHAKMPKACQCARAIVRILNGLEYKE